MTSLIWMLACPLGMAAMGGVAWTLSRLPGRRAKRLANLSRRATCMTIGHAAKDDTGAPAQTDAATHV